MAILENRYSFCLADSSLSWDNTADSFELLNGSTVAMGWVDWAIPAGANGAMGEFLLAEIKQNYF